MHRNFRVIVATLLVVAVVTASSAVLLQSVFAATGDDGQATIEAADSAIRQAFSNVLDAEKAGGNVSSLISQLDTAGSFLSDAENAYRPGNATVDDTNINSVQTIAETVNRDALILKDASIADAQRALWMNLIFSIVGSIALSIGLFVVWKKFKVAYQKKMLELKPEVTSNDAT